MNQQIKNKLVNEIAQMSHIMNNKISRHVGNQLCISVASGFHIHKTKTFPGVTIRPTETERHNNLLYHYSALNKCIGDDMKAAARQCPNCIKKTKT